MSQRPQKWSRTGHCRGPGSLTASGLARRSVVTSWCQWLSLRSTPSGTLATHSPARAGADPPRHRGLGCRRGFDGRHRENGPRNRRSAGSGAPAKRTDLCRCPHGAAAGHGRTVRGFSRRERLLSAGETGPAASSASGGSGDCRRRVLDAVFPARVGGFGVSGQALHAEDQALIAEGLLHPWHVGSAGLFRRDALLEVGGLVEVLDPTPCGGAGFARQVRPPGDESVRSPRC